LKNRFSVLQSGIFMSSVPATTRLSFALGVVFPLFALATLTRVQSTQPTTIPATPTGFDDAETFVFRDLSPQPLRLHIVKPIGWKPTDHRPALVFFFGGGWVKGSPERSIGWARTAAKWGLVGIAPDYRVKDRFGGTPQDCVAGCAGWMIAPRSWAST
jgi:acetyl esterase/lipase